MKKVLLIIALIAFSFGVFAQKDQRSVLVKAGYETDWKRFGIGAEGRYYIADQVRLAPDLVLFFPKNNTIGMDINVNAHYVFPLQDGLSIYPLAGLQMSNNRWSKSGDSNSWTDFGFNLGFGADYELDSKSYVNAQFQYTLNDWDYALFTVGYGIRF